MNKPIAEMSKEEEKEFMLPVSKRIREVLVNEFGINLPFILFCFERCKGGCGIATAQHFSRDMNGMLSNALKWMAGEADKQFDKYVSDTFEWVPVEQSTNVEKVT